MFPIFEALTPGFYAHCSFNGVPAEERLHWRSFLVKLGAENLRGVKNEELLVACHKYVYFSLFSSCTFNA